MMKIIVSFLMLFSLSLSAQTEDSTVKEKQVFNNVRAQYKYGDEGLQKHLIDHLKYPRAAIEGEVEGRVMVSFVIATDGKISGLEVINPDKDRKKYGLEEEAMRVVRLTNGDWLPSTMNGKPVETKFVLPVSFKLY